MADTNSPGTAGSTGTPSIREQIKADMAASVAAAEQRAQAFEQKQVGWLRANAQGLIIGLCVGALVAFWLAKL